MKKVVWRSMEQREWLLCYDFHTVKDLQMLESICYYVMNYDKQAGFKVFIILDHIIEGQETLQEQLVKTSTFLSGIGINLYPEQPSYDAIVVENSNLEYQVNISANQSNFSNKQIFNKMYRAIALCYVTAIRRYPRLRVLPFKRITDLLSFIKTKNISVEFNIFTISTYFGRMMSNLMAIAEERREVEELWEYLVD
jgi:hypothetical protein